MFGQLAGDGVHVRPMQTEAWHGRSSLSFVSQVRSDLSAGVGLHRIIHAHVHVRLQQEHPCSDGLDDHGSPPDPDHDNQYTHHTANAYANKLMDASHPRGCSFLILCHSHAVHGSSYDTFSMY